MCFSGLALSLQIIAFFEEEQGICGLGKWTHVSIFVCLFQVIESPTIPAVVDALLEAWRLYGSEKYIRSPGVDLHGQRV